MTVDVLMTSVHCGKVCYNMVTHYNIMLPLFKTQPLYEHLLLFEDFTVNDSLVRFNSAWALLGQSE